MELYLENKCILQHLMFELPVECDELLVKKENCRLDLGTFFNCFPASVWFENTNVRRVGLACSGTGCATFVVYEQRKNGDRVSIGEYEITLSDRVEFCGIEFDLYDDLSNILVVIEAEDDHFFLKEGVYCALDTQPQSTPKISIVACTYRREEMINRNIETIMRVINTWPGESPYSLIVVDNARTLTPSESEGLSILHNKVNVGGAGGFARGMLEAYAKGESSHVLLMDDDIMFHGEVLFRIYIFLAYCLNPAVSVGGIMLRSQEPQIVQEWGAVFPGNPIGLRTGHSVAGAEGLLPLSDDFDYNAWTCFCYPVSGEPLPFPFFIRGDDCEFGLRNNFRKVMLTGVGVWHHAFVVDSALMRFMTLRNELVINALFPRNGIVPYIRILCGPVYFALLFRYDTAHLVLDAIDAFLQGPDQFKDNDYSDLLKKYADYPEHGTQPVPYTFDAANFECTMLRPGGIWDRLKSLATINGHLWGGSKVAHSSAKSSDNSLGRGYDAGVIVYWNADRKTGYVARKSLRRFIRVVLRNVYVGMRFLFRFKQARRGYQSRREELTSHSFWARFLQI